MGPRLWKGTGRGESLLGRENVTWGLCETAASIETIYFCKIVEKTLMKVLMQWGMVYIWVSYASLQKKSKSGDWRHVCTNIDPLQINVYYFCQVPTTKSFFPKGLLRSSRSVPLASALFRRAWRSMFASYCRKEPDKNTGNHFFCIYNRTHLDLYVENGFFWTYPYIQNSWNHLNSSKFEYPNLISARRVISCTLASLVQYYKQKMLTIESTLPDGLIQSGFNKPARPFVNMMQ